MGEVGITKDDARVRGQVKILQHVYNMLDCAALRCALELHLADIINRHESPPTLSQIVAEIPSSSLDIDGLSRLMRFLVHKQLFDVVHQPESQETLYTLNDSSKWLLHDSKDTLASSIMMATDSFMISPLLYLHKSITEGGTAMKNTHGHEMYELASIKPEFNRVFNEGMACKTRMAMDAVMSNYGFGWLNGTLVDVAGGIGTAIKEIVSKYPKIKGINFDLPHVIANAPTYDGVTHVGGDMFEEVPPADSVFLKSILHNWNDDKCIQILKNCRKAISEKIGKVIIVDSVLYPGRDHMFDNTRMALDLLMFTLTDGGRERTEAEWKTLLMKAGFSGYNIVNIPAAECVIEAYID